MTDQDPDATAQAKDLTLGSTAGANGELMITAGGIAQTSGFLGVAVGVNSTGTLIVNGSGSTLTVDKTLVVGAYGVGIMRVENGGTVIANTDTAVGYVLGAEGELTISGAGSTFSNTSGQIGVGYAGTGTMTIEDGGMVTSQVATVGTTPGSVGTARVTGENSQWHNTKTFFVGNAGSGTLYIEDGGTVINDTDVRIGEYAGSNGRIEVTDNGSMLTASASLFVGSNGTGALTVSDGGNVSNEFGSIGYFTGSDGTVTVTGQGSTWTNSGALYVGYLGIGDLTIADGASVTVGLTSAIGYVSGSEGTVTVTGPGSTWTNSDVLWIGIDGNGTLTVADGGAVSSSGGSVLGYFSGSEGTATVSGAGSMWTDSGDLIVGKEGTGNLTVEDGGVVENFRTFIASSAGSVGNVTVTGTGSQLNTSGAFNGIYIGGDDISGGGEGHLLVEDGGSVNTRVVQIGVYSNEESSLHVSGVDAYGTSSSLTAEQLFIGTGSLTVDQGALSNTNYAFIGSGGNGTSTALIDGAGSRWSNSADILIGATNSGLLTISGGARVASNNSFIGMTNSAAALVAGAGSTWSNSADLWVGLSGNGTLTIRDGGTVNADVTTRIAYGTGTGTLNIGAASGEAAAAPGTLDTPLVSFGGKPGTLVFNHTDLTGSYVFAPNIVSGSGAATIEHDAGFTRLTGDGSGFAKTTNINGGTLAIENMLGGRVNVMSSGTLAGSGTATGNVTFNDGSYYLVEMDGTKSHQGLTVEGTATLDGTVMLAGDYGSIVGAGPVVIMTMESPFAGNFDGAVTPSIFVTPTLLLGQNLFTTYVLVSIEQTTAFADVADTQNQRSVADALDGLPGGTPIASALLMLGSEEAARDAYDQLSGETHASLKGALVENGQQAVRVVNDRIHDAIAADNNTTSVAAYGETVDPANGFWLTGYGNWMTTDATNNTAGMANDLYGVIAGIDHGFGEYGRLGILGGYSRTSTAVDALASEADADSYTIGVYGGANNGHAALSLGALYTWHSIDSTRFVTNPVTEMLNADYDARSLQLFAEAGYRMTTDRVTLEPFAGVSYINLQTDSFSETGGIAALSSRSETTATTFTTLGLRTAIELASNVQARGMTGWRHAFGDVDPASTFTIGGSTPFSILGAPIAQDAAVVEAGLDIQASDSVTIGASYEGQYGDGAIANGFNARLLAQF